MADLLEQITQIRATRPNAIAESFARRKRRPIMNERGTLLLIAADHTARGIIGVGANPTAIADRGDLLRRLVIALGRPGVDGILASPDIVDELLLLGALDDKLVIGSMNRGGLAGSVFELDDRFTAYPAEAIAAGLDGGKMMLRIANDDPSSLATMVACSLAVSELARRSLMTVIEVFASKRNAQGRIENVLEAPALMRAVGIASALGSTSAYMWLKLPILDEMERVIRATTLPTLLLGGDTGGENHRVFERWAQAMTIPQVRGLLVGRALLFPADGNVAAAVDAAAEIVARKNRGKVERT